MNRRTLVILGFAVLILVGFLVGRRTPSPRASQNPTPGPRIPSSSDSETSSAATPQVTPENVSATAPPSSLAENIEALFNKLRSGLGTDADFTKLEQLLSENPEKGIEAILEFLRTGQDAPTGQGFALGEGGILEEAPTLRLKLLDWLGKLTKQTGTGEAAAISRSILNGKSSADEWAIALRNIAWHEPQATGFLTAKLREMLAYQPWKARPSSGMLEAFDVIVYAQDTSFVPQLSGMLTGEQTQLKRAAAVALDRLAESAPLKMMTLLNTTPSLMADRPFVRADYFAKADLTQPLQRQAVETYLSRSDVQPEEKAKFFEELATPGTFVSDTLLTAPMPPINEERQKAIPAVMKDWLGADRFPELRPMIWELQQRLAM